MAVLKSADSQMPHAKRCPQCNSQVEVFDLISEATQLCQFCGSSLGNTFPQQFSVAADDSRQIRAIGRYEIVERLGGGSFGDVYLAYDPDLRREVAIKVPNAQNFSSNDAAEMFLKEAQRTAKLKHARLVTIYDVGRLSDGSVYVVMEYIKGTTLSNSIGGLTVNVQQAAKLIAEVAEAVHFAHRHGLVHRDLKPANILIDTQGEPRVADFGLAIHESEQHLLRGERSGTVAYMSPEQFRGQSHLLDGRSDIWSLGVIFYQLLAGRRPFQGGTLQELEDAVLNQDAKPIRQIRDQVPLSIERVCLKCLSKSPGDRYATAADLAADLRHANSERGVTWRRRRIVLSGVIGVVSLMMLGMASWYYWRMVVHPPVHTFDRFSNWPAIQIAGRLELTTSKDPDIYAALEGIAAIGWARCGECAFALLAATEDIREPVRYTAVAQMARWFDADSEHPRVEQFLLKLHQMVTERDANGRFAESERIRKVAAKVLNQFPLKEAPQLSIPAHPLTSPAEVDAPVEGSPPIQPESEVDQMLPLPEEAESPDSLRSTRSQCPIPMMSLERAIGQIVGA